VTVSLPLPRSCENRPVLLITHSNLFVGSGEDAISALVAVSPGTRYLVVTALPKFTKCFRGLSGVLGVPMDVLEAHFPREQFVTTVQKLCSWSALAGPRI
jgi:hypothetical protein